MKSKPTFRFSVWVVFFLALIGCAGSFFSQYVLQFNPCVMCIEQRMALIATLLTALVCAVVFSSKKAWQRLVQAAALSAAPLFGLYVALAQIRLQHLPPAARPDCGAPWTFRLRHAPLFEWYEPIIRGTGDCGQVDRLLGVPFPVWGALFFALVLLCVWTGWWRARRA